MPVEVDIKDLVRGVFRIGDWLVEPSLNRVSSGGETTQLELKVMGKGRKTWGKAWGGVYLAIFGF